MMLQRLDHVGIQVDDLPEAQAFLENVFGLIATRTIDAPTLGRKAIYFRCGEVEIEVFADTDPTVRKQSLSGRRALIDHIGIQVDNLAATMSTLATSGVRADKRGIVKLGDRLNAWTDPDSCDGVAYQLIEELGDTRQGPKR